MIIYKINILKTLKEKGYSSAKLRQQRIFGQRTIDDMRAGHVTLSDKNLSKLCYLLDMQPGDFLEYRPDDDTNAFFKNLEK